VVAVVAAGERGLLSPVDALRLMWRPLGRLLVEVSGLGTSRSATGLPSKTWLERIFQCLLPGETSMPTMRELLSRLRPPGDDDEGGGEGTAGSEVELERTLFGAASETAKASLERTPMRRKSLERGRGSMQ
jgi:hypothetical protein